MSQALAAPRLNKAPGPDGISCTVLRRLPLEAINFLSEVSGLEWQGSLVGPVLFNLYVNNIPKSPDTKLALFADDTALVAETWRGRLVGEASSLGVSITLTPATLIYYTCPILVRQLKHAVKQLQRRKKTDLPVFGLVDTLRVGLSKLALRVECGYGTAELRHGVEVVSNDSQDRMQPDLCLCGDIACEQQPEQSLWEGLFARGGLGCDKIPRQRLEECNVSDDSKAQLAQTNLSDDEEESEDYLPLSKWIKQFNSLTQFSFIIAREDCLPANPLPTLKTSSQDFPVTPPLMKIGFLVLNGTALEWCSLEGPGMVSSCSLEGPGTVGSYSLGGLWMVT
uniref:Reverse transcriptase domain-containing protein n=1 Tax=Timema genevievae TaxID=629358 RepID=A0A7R9JQ12_TIMGE|nr:unnamed protein product [Timema genevievae]